MARRRPTRPQEPAPTGGSRPRLGLAADGTSTPLGLLLKIVASACCAAVAVWGGLPLIDAENWLGLAILVAGHGARVLRLPVAARDPAEVPAAGHAVPDRLPDLPGDLHGHDGVHELRRRPPRQQGRGDHRHRGRLGPAGPGLGHLHADARDRGRPRHRRHRVPARRPGHRTTTFVGTADGLEELPADVERTSTGKITAADGYTVLDHRPGGAREADIATFSVPTDDGAIKSQGLSAGLRGRAAAELRRGLRLHHRRRRPVRPGPRTTETGSFVDENGDTLAQGWKVNVGFENFTRVLTNATIRGSFLRIVVWNFVFAIITVVITFALGLVVALALNNPLLKGKRFYRSLIILPYAMPAVAMYLVWREMFNTDFGLINRMLGIEINWFGTTATLDVRDPARAAVAGLQLHVPGDHRRPAVDPGRPHRGRRRRRREAVLRLPHDHVPAAAGGAGAAADRVVRVQLQQLRRDLPGQPRAARSRRTTRRPAPPTS